MFPIIKPKIVNLPLSLGNWAGMTVYPFIFLLKGTSQSTIINHELVHVEQQEPYWKVAGPLGIAAYLFLYLCVLPYKWHPWRTKWEVDAYVRGTGLTEEEAIEFVKEKYF